MDWLQSGIGVLVAAVASYFVNVILVKIIKAPTSKWRYIVIAGAFVLVFIAFLLVASPRARDVAKALFSGPADNRCFFNAKIVTPSGADLEIDAARYPASLNTKVLWEPNDCVMVIQSYQNNTLINELKSSVSGDVTLQQATLGRTGKMEVKIFREGFLTESFKIWIMATR